MISDSKRLKAAMVALAVVVGGSLVGACNTIEGMGKDVGAGGDAVSDTARDTKQKM